MLKGWKARFEKKAATMTKRKLPLDSISPDVIFKFENIEPKLTFSPGQAISSGRCRVSQKMRIAATKEDMPAKSHGHFSPQAAPTKPPKIAVGMLAQCVHFPDLASVP